MDDHSNKTFDLRLSYHTFENVSENSVVVQHPSIHTKSKHSSQHLIEVTITPLEDGDKKKVS